MKALAGAIVILTGGIMFTSSHFVHRGHALEFWGTIVGISGYIMLVIDYKEK